MILPAKAAETCRLLRRSLGASHQDARASALFFALFGTTTAPAFSVAIYPG
jgi:hypothetical protein